MMEFFKENPEALMDALATPPESEEDAKSVKAGATPKRPAFNLRTHKNADA